MPVILLTLLLFMTLGGGDNIFSLEDQDTDSRVTDLLSLEKFRPEQNNLELNKLIVGDFLPYEGDEILIVETFSGFGKSKENRFTISFGKIDSGNINIVSETLMSQGTPINLLKGKFSGFDSDTAIMHHLYPDNVQYLYTLVPSTDSEIKTDTIRAIPKSKNEEIATADMNGDGIDEIVIISLLSTKAQATDIDKIIVYFLTGNQDPQTESYAILPAPVLDIDVADINLDGKDEIITLRQTDQKNARQSIWAISRNDDGSYIEIPLVTGNQLALIPSPPESKRLFYSTIEGSSGHFYRWINALELEKPKLEKINEFRLLPEGLVMGMTWGHFANKNDNTLALIINETLTKRRWIAFYTPFEKNNIVNKVVIFTSENYDPKGTSPVACDMDSDGLDELLYINETGKLIEFNPRTQKSSLVRILVPEE